MPLIAAVTGDDKLMEDIKLLLPEFTVYPMTTLVALEESLLYHSFDIVIVDAFLTQYSNLDSILQQLPKDSVVFIRRTAEKMKQFYFSIEESNIFSDLKPYVELLLQRKLPPQISTADSHSDALHPSTSGQGSTLPQYSASLIQKNVLLNFSEVLTLNFDIDKTVGHFLDLITGIVRVARIAILLREGTAFSVKAYRGMDPSLMKKIKLERTSALVIYLSKYGKIIRKPLRTIEPHEVSISGEMSMLRCSIVVPMVCGGRLEGLLALGGKITGDAFTNEELELIYMLCNNVIAIINDYRLHHEIQRQGDFIANILANMNSGVITIDPEQKISVINKKASEILGLDGDKLIGKDLRNLPSPLGDLLFETLSMGSIFNRYEAALGSSKTLVGINSYTLNNQNGDIVGSGIIFSDISTQKRLDSEKRKAERFQLINMLSGKIAHEIKNPLSTIQTFSQLLQERYDDRDFRQYFIQTVIPSVSRLNNLIDKIIIFSNPLDFTPGPTDLSIIITDAVERIREELPFSRLSRGAPLPIQINADAQLLFKGVYYLLYTCCEHAKDGSPIEINIHPAAGGLVAVMIRFTAIGDMTDITDEPLKVLELDSLGVEFDIHVVRKIIEEHNGKLEIRHPDSMTEFVFLLPINQQIKNQQEVI